MKRPIPIIVCDVDLDPLLLYQILDNLWMAAHASVLKSGISVLVRGLEVDIVLALGEVFKKLKIAEKTQKVKKRQLRLNLKVEQSRRHSDCTRRLGVPHTGS